MASSRLVLIIEQDEANETHNMDDSEDDDFPVTRFNVDRRVHAHHKPMLGG